MFIGHFTEQPWQDESTNLYGVRNTTLDISNRLYNPEIGADLYNRYLDEKMYAEEKLKADIREEALQKKW